MSVRRPALALALTTAAATMVLREVSVPYNALPWIGALSCILCFCRLPYCNGIRRLAVGMFLGCALVSLTAWEPAPPHGIERMRVRIEGVVCFAQPSAYGGWLVVVGDVDPAATAATQCTVIVRCQNSVSTGSLPDVGSWIVATGSIHLPQEAQTVQDDDVRRERGWLQSRAAALFVDVGVAGGIWVQRPAPWWQMFLHASAGWMRERLDQLLLPETATMMKALLIGDRQDLDARDRLAFAATGTAHVLSISGMHVSILIEVLLTILGTNGAIRRWWQWSAVAIVVLFYVLMTGAEPPAIRAAFMALLMGIGRLRQTSVDGLNILGATTLLQVWVWPSLIVRPSFILSTVVTAALLWGVPRWRTALQHCIVRSRPWKRHVATAVAVSMAATAGSVIPTAVLLQQVSLVGPIANLLFMPGITLAMLCGMATVALSTVWWQGAAMMAWTTDMIMLAHLEAIRWFASVLPAVEATPLIAVAVFVATWWPARTQHLLGWRTLCSRSFAAWMIVILIVGATGALDSKSDGVTVVERRGSLRIQASAKYDTATVQRVCFIGLRNGRPFVRLRNDALP